MAAIGIGKQTLGGLANLPRRSKAYYGFGSPSFNMRAMMAGGTFARRYADEGALRSRACAARYTAGLPLAPANATA